MHFDFNSKGGVRHTARILLLQQAFVWSAWLAVAASTPQPPAGVFLRIDAGVVADASDNEAKHRYAELASQFDGCLNGRGNSDAAVNCLRALIAEQVTVSVGEPSSPRESTLSGLLLDRRGNCAALVALGLSLAPDAFSAYVLRDHVVLVTRVGPPRYLELTDRARETSTRELRNRFGTQLDDAATVKASSFPVYYLDNLAVRLAREGREADADRLFRQAVAEGPKVARPRLNYGTFLIDRGRIEEAIRHLEIAVRRAPNVADAWTNLGVACARAGNGDRAVRCLERALRVDPGHQVALTNLAALRRVAPAPRP